MFLHGTSRINDQGHLEIGGCDTTKLAMEYGTPLFIYDEAFIREKCRSFKQSFVEKGIEAQVAYASKAFSSIAMFQLIAQEGLSLDVVSGGELYTALQANFPVEKIHFHGNNKTEAELRMALEAQIGCIVVDNFSEIELLHRLAKEMEQQVQILIRSTPGVEAHTHEYISTGQEDSKFGFNLANGQLEKALQRSLTLPFLNVLGIHSHIGSQIFETEGFILAIEKLALFVEEMERKYNWQLQVLNVGGGFGIRYMEGDQPLSIQEYVYSICDAVQKEWSTRRKQIPQIWVEPGRSLVGDAGTTIYSVGSQKKIPGVRDYISIDGGMSDNLRVALYQAKYEAALANRMRDDANKKVTIAGKLCETGDILIWDQPLPEAKEGDTLAVFCTGAYGYAMANNYNRITRPAVIFVADGEATLIVRRESYEDLIRNDLPLAAKVTQK